MVWLFHSLGYEVASIGSYIDPAHPHDPKRPALPKVPCVQEVKDAVDSIGSDDNLGAAQSFLPEGVLTWLGSDGIVLYHHQLERCFGQWAHLKDWGGRVIWRTVGQSVESNERRAAEFREDGLEIVRYSPKERNIPWYAGEDALIRFYKREDLYCGWTGEERAVVNITQNLFDRGAYCNPQWFIDVATRLEGVPVWLAGPGSEKHGGEGTVTEEYMRNILQRGRIYLYTGTQPASYTLGLLEALITGIPVISIGPSHMQIFPYGPELFEGHELATLFYEEPIAAVAAIDTLIDCDLQLISDHQREKAIALFGVEKARAAWGAYLG